MRLMDLHFTRNVPLLFRLFLIISLVSPPLFGTSLQVTYKKFQIPCPFEEFSVNSTAAHHGLNVSTHAHEYTNGLLHDADDSHCAPRMFTVNSQVMM